MRQPRARGSAVDDARVSGWMERFGGYRVHVSRQRIQEWLNQFENGHRDLGARILDAVEFYREDHLTHAYRAVFGRLPGWSRTASERQGHWRFVAFSMHAGESGDRMLHTFRVANGLSAARFENLFIRKSELLRQNLGGADTVVFVDDFAGTGEQAVTAWKESLGELLPGRPRIFLVLAVAVRQAITRIGEETPIKVHAFRNLRERDNFFAPECIRFGHTEKTRALDYCKLADAENPRGYGGCGILLVLAHRCPNNSLPILHSTRPAFPGLFPR